MRKIGLAVVAIIAIVAFFCLNKKSELPVVAIVSYGPIPPMESSIKGIKEQLAAQGFIENETIRYEIADICFDHTLIPQTVTNLKDHNPTVVVVTATPIAQFAKRKIQNIPIIYNTITDPVDAGLIKDKDNPEGNITGSSDMQDLGAFLAFAKSILPQAKTVGLLYAISDSNDVSLLKMMRLAASSIGISVLAIPIDQVRDIPLRMQAFNGKADFIYVGASGLQSALPAIASEAQKMMIPVFNMEEQAVLDDLVLASFGVNYESVGKNAGKLIGKLLSGSHISTITPVYPSIHDHQCFVNKRQAEKFGIKIPKNAIVVEKNHAATK